MKKAFIIISILALLSGCTGKPSSTVIDYDPSTKLIVYDNNFGIKYNHPNIELPDEVEDYDALFGSFFLKSSTWNSKLCKNDKKPPKEILLFSWDIDPPKEDTVGWEGASQSALICEKKYLIENTSGAGKFYYGPFPL